MTEPTNEMLSESGFTAVDATEEAALQIDEQQLTRQALWERKLLDFSLRNNLLNTRLGKRVVQFVSFGVGGMEDALQSGQNFTIQTWPEERKKLDTEDGLYHSDTQAAPLQEQAEKDLKDHRLTTYLTATELKAVLTNLYRGARTALEENGANSLFIAIGMMKWYVTEKSDQPRYAPVLLLPVNLLRVAGGYVVRIREEETILNITLNEFLKQQFKLPVPTLDPLPRDEHGVDVPLIFQTIRQTIRSQARWELLEETALGLFSFNKFVMWNDIHTHAERLQENPIVESLVQRRLMLNDSFERLNMRVFDETVPPAEVATPISADSSQLEAVVESGRGKSFILYGPPGTGKSQTITNMIANALYQGKRVLFVAEKMAALQVVQRRLTQIGLEPFCLELHSNKVTKSHFLGQLQQALDVKHGHLSEDFYERSQELFELRRQLNAHIMAMHVKAECGLSLYDCMEHYLAMEDVGEMQLPPAFVSKVETDELEVITAELQQLDTLFRVSGHPAHHPLTGLYIEDDRREAMDSMEQLLTRLSQAHIGQPRELAEEWNSIQGKWFLSRLFAVNTFLKKLQKIEPALTKSGIPAFLQRLSTIPSVEAIPQWLEHRSEWREWAAWSQRRMKLIQEGWQPVVSYLEEGHSGELTAQVLARTLYKEWGLAIIDADPHLRRFNGLVFDDVIARYRQLTAHFQELTKKELYCRLAARIPSITIEAATSSEVNILKRNIANGGRGTSIRHIIDQIPNLLPKLCPCVLMSPISVAQFIDIEQPKFDLVIFDEASQMPTAEAVGTIGRGKALVVVGDNKQMPPTSFFATQQVDDEDAELDDLDSILDDCQALSVPNHYLAFHYRSKHESLIAFSNQEYYDGRLYTFPSADDRLTKVSLVPVEGVYDKGGRRSNRAEAEAVVMEIIRRLADDELSKRSIGVVAFSVAQQNLIEDVLMEVISGKPEMEQRAFSGDEPVFIKNLENVQGDERDVILFSIGYGPDKDGNVSMNFGPLNNRGGERRLNVAVSRARYEMKVFSTLRPEQIDLRRSSALGVIGLKKFLQYAATGVLSEVDVPTSSASSGPAPETATASDAVAQSIVAELRVLGYEASTGVGRSKFKVDVAVLDPADPNRYLLGILIDGPARLLTQIARDRELTQTSVLQGLGWKMMRVWSLDWMARRQQVLDAIVKELKGSSAVTDEPLVLKSPTIIEEHKGPVAVSALASTPEVKQDVETISAEKLQKLILQIVQEQVALPVDDILRAAARALGYSRRGPRVDAAVMRTVATLITRGKLIREGETIRAAS